MTDEELMNNPKWKRLNAALDAIELLGSGYAGVDRNGRIVDRRSDKEAVPIKKLQSIGTPEPKVIY